MSIEEKIEEIHNQSEDTLINGDEQTNYDTNIEGVVHEYITSSIYNIYKNVTSLNDVFKL